MNLQQKVARINGLTDSLWKRSLALPGDLLNDLLVDVQSYYEGVLKVLETHAQARVQSRPLQLVAAN